MTTRVKTDSSLPGTLLDLLVLGVAVWAVFTFTHGYRWWTEFRTEEFAGVSCLQALDADCFLDEMNTAYGTHSVPMSENSDRQGQWIWALRLMNTEGSMDARLDQLMSASAGIDGYSKGLTKFALPSLLEVTTILNTIKGREAGARFSEAVIAKQKSLGSPVSYELQDKSFGVQTWGPPMRCQTPDEIADLRSRDVLETLLLTEDISHPCMLLYFAEKDDAALQGFINRNLEAMNAVRQKYGEATQGRGFEHMPTPLYADNLAFLASIIAYRKNGGLDF